VRPAGEESATALENLVAATAGDALVIVEGGNLSPRSSLRTLAETEPCLAALPCYMDNEGALEALVESTAKGHGFAVEPDALDWIVERLGGDRAQTRSELDKLMLYKQGDGTKAVTQADALAVLGDTSAIGIDDVVGATFDGEMVALDRALDRVFAEGGNPVQLVRALQRHADQLHLVAGMIDKGVPSDVALQKVRGLPRFGPGRQRFERHLRGWSVKVLSAALQTILDAELQCKSTGLPDETIARRLCQRLAQAGPGARKRR
jgi:DNA polymerase-3 subunit delta